VARSGLGTINHTLLSLQALRAAGIPICGVVMNGPPSSGNRTAIERFGNVRVIAEIPQLTTIDTPALARLAQALPDYENVTAGAR
jgi:malonyl-CoA O-methyltransferase